jgi:hypothetical protein
MAWPWTSLDRSPRAGALDAGRSVAGSGFDGGDAFSTL